MPSTNMALPKKNNNSSSHHHQNLSLLNLPNEILYIIADHVETVSNVSALVLTCKHFHQLFNDTMYRYDSQHKSAALTWAIPGDYRFNTIRKSMKLDPSGCRISHLRQAATKGSYSLMKYLLGFASVRSQLWLSNSGNMTRKDNPLIAAVENKHHQVIELLLDSGMRLHQSQVDICMVIAARLGDVQTLTLLIENGGGDIEGNLVADVAGRPIYKAVEYSRLEALKFLIAKGVNVNVHDEGIGCSPIHLAAEYDRMDILQTLVEAGADPNIRDFLGCHPIHHTVHWPSIRGMKLLLENGADANAHNDDNSTALAMATEDGLTDRVQLLLKYGASPNPIPHSRRSPAVGAMWNESIELMQLLVDHGLDLANWPARTTSPLHAVRSVEMARYLLKQGANVNGLESASGNTPLHMCRNVETCKLLLDNGADVNAVNDDHATPLFEAISARNMDIMYVLLDADADVTIANEIGLTPLHLAIELGHFDEDDIRVLINCGADVNAKVSDDYETPLLAAAARGAKRHASSIAYVELLIGAGADPRATYRHGATALHRAAKRGDVKLMNLLVNELKVLDIDVADHRGQTALMCPDGHDPYSSGCTTKWLLENGANPSAVDQAGNTALHYAVGKGSHSTMCFLAVHGADMEAANNHGETPLMLAAGGWASPAMLDAMIGMGVDVLKRNTLDGRSVIHYLWNSNRVGNEDAAELLVGHGADINAQDDNGRTPLFLAVMRRRSLRILKKMVALGADINVPDNDRQVVLDVANEVSAQLLNEVLNASVQTATAAAALVAVPKWAYT